VSDVNTPDVERPGIDRRTLIKRVAASGAIAWAAPVIIDSLASPAAALSCTGCFRLQVDANNPCSSSTSTVSTGGGLSPCPTLTATGCTSLTNVASGVNVDGFSGVCMSGPSGGVDCQKFNIVVFILASTNLCPWGGGGTCNETRQFLAAQAKKHSEDEDGSSCATVSSGNVTITATSVRFTKSASEQWDWFQFIIGCTCA
jgi:hypothetical protein